MDVSLVAAALQSLRAAKEIGAAAVGVRDFNLLAVEMAKLNAELLKAQDSLFAHGETLLQIREQNLDLADKLRKAEAALQERGNYALFEIGRGKFVYRFHGGQAGQEGVAPAGLQPLHYLCQPCFDAGSKQVLRLYLDAADGPVACCPACKVFFNCERIAG